MWTNRTCPNEGLQHDKRSSPTPPCPPSSLVPVPKFPSSPTTLYTYFAAHHFPLQQQARMREDHPPGCEGRDTVSSPGLTAGLRGARLRREVDGNPNLQSSMPQIHLEDGMKVTRVRPWPSARHMVIGVHHGQGQQGTTFQRHIWLGESR